VSKAEAKTTIVMLKSAALSEQLDDERAALDAAKTRLAELETKRRQLLLGSDDDAALAAHDDDLAAAKRAVDRHAARAAKLEREHQEVTAAEAEAERLHQIRSRWNERKRIVQDGHQALSDYARICGELVHCLKRMEAGDRAAAETFDDRPEGEEKLSGPSHSRHTPFVPRRTEIVKESHWTDPAGRRVAVAVKGGEPIDAGVRRALVEIEYTRPPQYAWTPEPLYQTVSLPRVHKNDHDFWKPQDD